jgi:rare lipoprotein A (peptidoglycan hydrolase)
MQGNICDGSLFYVHTFLNFGQPEQLESNFRTKMGTEVYQSGKSRWLRHTEKGLTSWYGKQFAGRPTASGELFSPEVWQGGGAKKAALEFLF